MKKKRPLTQSSSTRSDCRGVANAGLGEMGTKEEKKSRGKGRPSLERRNKGGGEFKKDWKLKTVTREGGVRVSWKENHHLGTHDERRRECQRNRVSAWGE